MKGPHVVLRIRILKIHGPGHRIPGIINLLTSGRVVRLGSHKSEWAIFYLTSSDESITFQASSSNASCLCKDISGTKRIDFDNGIRMLVEGYSVPYAGDNVSLSVHVDSTLRTTSNCTLVYPSTNSDKRCSGYGVFDGEMLAGAPFSSASHELVISKEVVKSAHPSPVDIALGWMDYSLKESPSQIRPTHKFDPTFGYEERKVWTKELTSLSANHTPSTSADIVGVRRALEFSENLTRAFIP